MKLLVNGESCEAVRCQVAQSDERVSTFLLGDGTVVKVRCLPTGISRITGKLDVDGQPVYRINWHLMPIIEAVDHE